MDEKEFFREATLRICGSLEIEVALWRCLLFLKETIPVDTMFLNIIEMPLGIIRTIAKADATGGKIVSFKTILPEASRSWALQLLESSADKPFLYTVSRMRNHKTGGPFSETMGIPDWPVLAMFPQLGGQLLGGVVLTNSSGQSYSEEHVRLLKLLNEPFGIAISNYSRFREILRLKDLLAEENRYLSDELRDYIGDEIVGAKFGLKRVMDLVQQVAPLSSPVLLIGETGVGKEVIANAIHHWSSRRGGPFIKVNCGAIPETLVDSELFGHEKGAFTGAIARKRGRFERAQHGTIFLDEIGDLPAGAQMRLLRVLQEKEIERVGGSGPIKVDIRVIAATHRNLEAMLREGRFREDLYFRLRVFPILIPPLRERLEDIPALVHHFMLKKTKEMSLAQVPTLSPSAIGLLTNYNWPGNVRELQNAVERELIVSNGEPLTFSNLIPPNPEKIEVPQALTSFSGSFNTVVSMYIMKTLEITGGKVEGPNGAARLLDMNPSTLRNKMKKLGIPFGRTPKPNKKEV